MTLLEENQQFIKDREVIAVRGVLTNILVDLVIEKNEVEDHDESSIGYKKGIDYAMNKVREELKEYE